VRSSLALVLLLAGCPAAGRSPERAPAAASPAPAAERALRVPASDIHELQVDGAGGVSLFLRAVSSRRGRTALLLHGGPAISHEYLRPLETLASDALRVVSFDQRGTGRSSAPPDGRHDFDAHADDIEAVREALGTEQLDLVGHSWGGLLAIAYAIKYPAHVRSLVLIDAVPPTTQDKNAGFWYLSERLATLRAEGVPPRGAPPPAERDCEAQLIAKLPGYYADPRHPATRDLAGSTCDTAVNLETWRQVDPYDLTALAGGITAPALVIQGESSPFTRQWHDAVVRALTGSQVQQALLPACGHIPWEECPEPFWRLVEDFLAAR
jgi:proline iminopeptidase